MQKVVVRGRSGAMTQVLGGLRKARSRQQGGVILLTGEMGIGKSTVFDAAVAQAAAMQFAWGTATADRTTHRSPAGALLLALRSGPRPLASARQLRDLTACQNNPVLLLDAVTDLLHRSASEYPVLLGIDNAQWCDPVSRFVLRSLPARLVSSAAVLLLAGRVTGDDVITDLNTVAFATRHTESVDLAPLSPADVIAVAGDRLGHAPSPPLADILNGTGGNPFFVTQILEGALRSGTADAEVFEIPAEFGLSVHGLLSTLSSPTQDLLDVAAVYQQGLCLDHAIALLPDLQPQTVLDSMMEACRAGLLDRDSDGKVRYRQPLIREVIYGELNAHPRQEYHRRCIHVLGATSSDLVEITHHALAGLRLGDEATARIVADTARRAAESMPGAASDLMLIAFGSVRPGRRSWLTIGQQCVELLSIVQRCPEAVEIADQLLAYLDDAEAIAEIEIAVARALWLTSDWQASIERSSRALARPGLSAPLKARLSALNTLALSRVEPAPSSLRMARTALQEAERLDDEPTQLLSWHALAETARNKADHEESLHRYRALRSASGQTYRAQEIQGLQYLDRFDDATVMLKMARSELDQDRGLLFLSIVYSQAWCDYNLARFEAVETGARMLLDLAAAHSNRIFGLEAASLLSLTALQRGQLPAARKHLTAGFGPATSTEELQAPSLLLVRGWLIASEGAVDEAVSMLKPLVSAGREGRDPWPSRPGWLRTLTRIGLAAGAQEFTGEVAYLAELGARRNPDVSSLVGIALQIRGMIDRDPDKLREAADVLARSPRPMMQASGKEELGRSLLSQGDKHQGAALLDAAWEIYHRVGATGPMREVQSAMRAAGLRRSRWEAGKPRSISGWDSLTQAEYRVARLIVSGQTNKAAARELNISLNTVATHLRSVFSKLDVHSRVQLSNVLHD